MVMLAKLKPKLYVCEALALAFHICCYLASGTDEYTADKRDLQRGGHDMKEYRSEQEGYTSVKV